jgi:hypothetical protein
VIFTPMPRGAFVADLLTVLASSTAVAASAATVIGIVHTASAAARAKTAALAAVHVDLTSGEVAAARDVMGTFRYSQDGGRMPERVTDADAVRAYFAILWAVERADNALSYYSARSQRRASAFIGWNLDELTRNMVWFRTAHGARLHLDDSHSWSRFRHMLRSHVVSGSVQKALSEADGTAVAAGSGTTT